MQDVRRLSKGGPDAMNGRMTRLVRAGMAAVLGWTLTVCAGVRETVRRFELEPERQSARYKRVVDPEADNGLAGVCPKVAEPGTVWSATRYGERPGRYRLSLRLKLDEPPPAKQTLLKFYVYETPNRRRRHATLPIVSEQISAVGKYVEVSAEFDRWEGPPIVYKLLREEVAARMTVDWLEARLVRRFTDAELLEKDPPPAKPAGLAMKRDKTLDIHVVRGSFFSTWRMPAAIGAVRRAKATASVYESIYRPFPLLDYPTGWQDLFGKDVVVLFNADAYAVDAAHRQMLVEFVKAGGGLLVFGGRWALAQGEYDGTCLEALLPIDVAKGKLATLGRAPLKLHAHAVAKGAGSLDGAPLVEVFGAPVKPGATVVCSAGDHAVLALRRVGRGRVAVFAASCYGSYPDGSTPIWQHKAWPTLMRNVLTWLAGTKGGAK